MKKVKSILILLLFFVIIGTINLIDSKVYGATISSIDVTVDLSNAMPKIGVRKAANVPVTIETNNVNAYSSGYYWEKKVNGSWTYFSGTTFDNSEYRYHLRFEVNSSVATVSNPVTVKVKTIYKDKDTQTIKNVTENISATTSLVSGKYYISAYSKSFVAEDNTTYTAQAYASPDYSGEVYIGSNQIETGTHMTYTYAESEYNIGVFNVKPKAGYVFKEWRVGSATGSPVIITDEDIKKPEYKNAPYYIDKNNGIHYRLKDNYVFYAIFERSSISTQVLKGDLNTDGFVNATDAAMALDIFKNNTLTDVYIIIGDMNGDNLINSTDSAMMLDAYKNHTVLPNVQI